MKTMVIFFKDCDVQMFFVDKNYRGCVIYSKNMVKNEKKVDICIKCLANSLLNKDMIVL